MSTTETDIRHLLPFWVNGTLTGKDHDRVALALQNSEVLRAEVAALAALRNRMQKAPMRASPGALGLARLMREIDAEPSRKAFNWRGAGLIAASVAAAAVFSSALTVAVMDRGTGGDPVYEQASGDDPGAALTVSFRPEVSEGVISALLRKRGLTIIDGPSAIGLYRIALPFDADLAEVARYLEAASEVIATVEEAE